MTIWKSVGSYPNLLLLEHPNRMVYLRRRNRTLLDMVRSMMSHADLPNSFWGHALLTTTYTLNRVPSKKVEKTPYEIWSGKKPHMSYIKIWGCEVYVKWQVSTKLEPKSDRCLFVGYPEETRGYYFYNPSEGKVFVARTGVFLEKGFYFQRNQWEESRAWRKSRITKHRYTYGGIRAGNTSSCGRVTCSSRTRPA